MCVLCSLVSSFRYRFFPIILSPWFVFGSNVSLEDIRAAKEKRIPPGVKLKEVGEFLVGLHDTGGNLLGVLHSMGYIRGILNNLSFPERRRIKSFARFSALGGAHEVEPRQEDKVPAAPNTASAMAEVRVDLLALLITVLAPLALVILVLGKRTTAGIAAAIFALVAGVIVQSYQP